MDRTNDVYLGDGLYAHYEKESDQVVLYAHNGVRATATVYLEAQTLTAFFEYVKNLERWRQRAYADNSNRHIQTGLRWLPLQRDQARDRVQRAAVLQKVLHADGLR